MKLNSSLGRMEGQCMGIHNGKCLTSKDQKFRNWTFCFTVYALMYSDLKPVPHPLSLNIKPL